jgi:reticulon-3
VIVEKVADHALVWINRLLAIDHDIAIKRDRKVSIKVCLYLRFLISQTIVYLFLIMCALPYPCSP